MTMADVLFIAITLAFFALTAALVRAIDHIIGDDTASVGETPATAASEATTSASTPSDELVAS
jgi:hypothetical protein